MLSKSDLQHSMLAPRSTGQPGQPRRAPTSTALSNLAPHDLHTGATHGGSSTSRPNPFESNPKQEQIG